MSRYYWLWHIKDWGIHHCGPRGIVGVPHDFVTNCGLVMRQQVSYYACLLLPRTLLQSLIYIFLSYQKNKSIAGCSLDVLPSMGTSVPYFATDDRLVWVQGSTVS